MIRATYFSFRLTIFAIAMSCGIALANERPTIPVQIDVPKEITNGLWPVTFGVAFPRDTLRDHQRVIAQANGVQLPTQTDVLAFWNDGLEQGNDIRWLLVDFQVDAATARNTTFNLAILEQPRAKRSPLPALSADGLEVNTGAAQFRFSLDEGLQITSAKVGTTELLARPMSFFVLDQDNKRYEAQGDIGEKLLVEDAGAQRLVLRSEGWYRSDDGVPFCQHIIRFAFFAGSTRVQLLHTFVFTGTSDSHQLRDIAVALPLNTGEETRTTFGIDASDLSRVWGSPDAGPVLLEQDCDDRWHLEFELWRRGESKPAATGSKWGGWSNLSGKTGGVTAALREAWQNYPNEMESDNGTLTVHFWPRHGRPLDFRTSALLEPYGLDGMEMIDAFFKSQAEPYGRSIWDVENNAMGVAKTHELWLDFHTDKMDVGHAVQLAHQAHTPVLANADPKWNCASKALGPLHPYDPETFPRTEQALDAMFDRYIYWRDHYMDFGWFDYQDVHCSTRSDDFGHQAEGGPIARLWRYWDSTHYGLPNTPWLYYLRTGKRKYLAFAEANARHCMDIDRCHFGNEKDRYKGGHYYCNWSIIPWNRRTETHINYNKLEYMLYAYYLRGYRRGLKLMKEWADLSLRYYLDGKGPDPFQMIQPASFKHIRHYGPPLGNMTELYRVTYDKRYLEAAHNWARALIDMHPKKNEQWAKFGAVHYCWGGMANYLRLTGDEEFRKTVASYAGVSTAQAMRAGSAGDAAHGFTATGDTSFLDHGKLLLSLLNANTNIGNIASQRGTIGGWAAGRHPHAMRTIPVLMAAMTSAPAEWRNHELPMLTASTAYHSSGPVHSPLYVQTNGQNAIVSLALGRNQAVEIVDATGKKVAAASAQFPPVTTQLTLPAAKTAYRATFPIHPTRSKADYSERGFVDLLRVQNGKTAIAPSTDDGRFCIFGERFHFMVPAGVEDVSVEVRVADTWAVYAWHPQVHLYGPDGQIVASGGDGEQFKLTATASPEQQGRLWSLGPIGRVSAPYDNGSSRKPWREPDQPFPAWFKLGPDLPKFVSPSATAFFLPEPTRPE